MLIFTLIAEFKRLTKRYPESLENEMLYLEY